MPRFKDYNQNQPMLLPPDIRGWLPNDHICFVINDIVDKLNINSIIRTYSEQGSPAYDPRMMIKIMFYSYSQGIRSSRKIESLSQENIAFRYLSANQQPDHGTISLFRKDHLQDLEDVFAQIVILCDGLKLIDPTNISIDGSIFKANASRRTTYDKKTISQVKKKIKEIFEKANQIDELEDKHYGHRRGYNQIPDKWKDKANRDKEIERLKRKMKQLNQANKIINNKQKQVTTKEEKNLSRNKTLNTTDKDARLMKLKGGQIYHPAYNGQIATSNQIITAYEISKENVDTPLLLPMIEKTAKNSGKQVRKVKADASYFSKDNIIGIKEKKIDSYIPDQKKTIEEKQERENSMPKYDRRNFTYQPKKNQYTKEYFICPRGKSLKLLKLVLMKINNRSRCEKIHRHRM